MTPEFSKRMARFVNLPFFASLDKSIRESFLNRMELAETFSDLSAEDQKLVQTGEKEKRSYFSILSEE